MELEEAIKILEDDNSSSSIELIKKIDMLDLVKCDIQAYIHEAFCEPVFESIFEEYSQDSEVYQAAKTLQQYFSEQYKEKN